MSDWGTNYGPYDLPDWVVGDDLDRTLTTSRLQRLNDAIMRGRPLVGPGLLQTSNGWMIADFSDPVSGNPATPYQGFDASDTTAAKVMVSFGTHNNVPPQIDGTDLIPPIGTPAPALNVGTSEGPVYVYVEFDFSFDATGNITAYTGKKIDYATSSTDVPASTLNFNDDGSGTGSFYQTLFGATVNAPAGSGGSYSVSNISPNITSSQVFYICGTQLLY